jgi:hypothetical protein
MKQYILIGVVLLTAATSAAARAADDSAGFDASRISVQAGLGFFAEDNLDGFMLNFEGLYRIDANWSAGADLQLGFENDFLLLSMPFFGRYDFGDLPIDAPHFSKIHPFAKLGLGFTYAEIDGRIRTPALPGFPSTTIDFNADDTGFLFIMAGGFAYPINEHFSLESTMQFNITTNDFFEDDFYFSWEIISLRYTF